MALRIILNNVVDANDTHAMLAVVEWFCEQHQRRASGVPVVYALDVGGERRHYSAWWTNARAITVRRANA